jgi:hypothetical protein
MQTEAENKGVGVKETIPVIVTLADLQIRQAKVPEDNKPRNYNKSREVLTGLRSSLSDDIIKDRMK